MNRSISILLIQLIFFLISCEPEPSAPPDNNSNSTFTDSRDGHIYKLRNIGNQVWMAENLAYLPWVDLPSTVSSASPKFYVYGFGGTNTNDAKSSSNYQTYGVLYNWPAAMNGEDSSSTNPSGVQGVCPSGWHLPSNAEWTEMIDFLGTDTAAGGSMKEMGTNHWAYPNAGANNTSGFNALPGGYRNYSGEFLDIGTKSYWWSSKGRPLSGAYVFGNYYNNNDILRWNVDVGYGISIRCVKDD
jgi:uncharacterized protein (TIGR02145 family)